MNTKLASILLAAGIAFAGSVHAETIVVSPPTNPLEPAVELPVPAVSHALQIVSKSMTEAKRMMTARGARIWKVVAVEAPTCEPAPLSEKKLTKKCLAQKAKCRKAEQFAASQGVHAVCLTLYSQTKVLLTDKSVSSETSSKVKATVHKRAYQAGLAARKLEAKSADGPSAR